MLTRADIAIYQGDDYEALVTVLPGTPSQSPVDLTGSTAAGQIRTGPADSSPVVVEIQAAIVLPDKVALFIPAATTVCLSGVYSWDLQLTDVAGIVTTLLAGAVIATPEITRVPSPVETPFDPVAIAAGQVWHATLTQGVPPNRAGRR